MNDENEHAEVARPMIPANSPCGNEGHTNHEDVEGIAARPNCGRAPTTASGATELASPPGTEWGMKRMVDGAEPLILVIMFMLITPAAIEILKWFGAHPIPFVLVVASSLAGLSIRPTALHQGGYVRRAAWMVSWSILAAMVGMSIFAVARFNMPCMIVLVASILAGLSMRQTAAHQGGYVRRAAWMVSWSILAAMVGMSIFAVARFDMPYMIVLVVIAMFLFVLAMCARRKSLPISVNRSEVWACGLLYACLLSANFWIISGDMKRTVVLGNTALLVIGGSVLLMAFREKQHRSH